MEETGSKYLGFVPDMGAFTKRLARSANRQDDKRRCRSKDVEFVCEQHEKGVMAEYIHCTR
jgi:hypothetical protein